MSHHIALSPRRAGAEQQRGGEPHRSPSPSTGVLLAALAGAVLLLPFGFIPWGDDTGAALRLVTMAALGLLMGACTGAVYVGDRLVDRRRSERLVSRGERR